jgi:hypothetical protein
MKKILTIALAMSFGVAASAQSNDQIQNKKGADLLPVKGEYAIGIGTNLQTLTGFVGNMFNNDQNNSINSTFLNHPATGASIFGKYMMSDNMALRVTLNQFGGDNTSVFEVYDDRANDPDSMVYDKVRTNSSFTAVSAGLEWRRGKSRLRGFYGGEAVLSWNSGHTHYTYGNLLGGTNVTPTDNAAMPAYNGQHGRTTQIRNGATFGVGARGFAGVEYFIAPKICIGTEFGWSLRFNKSGDSKTTYEKWDPFYDNGTGGIVTYTDQTNQGGWGINSGIDNFNSQIFFHFYF